MDLQRAKELLSDLADDAVLCQMFDAGGSRKEMCAYFKRSEGSLAARLVRLGKISDRAEFRMK